MSLPALVPSDHFEERVEALVEDWKGQDEIFYHSRARQTIAWCFGRAKSLDEAVAEIRKNTGGGSSRLSATPMGFRSGGRMKRYRYTANSPAKGVILAPR